MSALSAEMRAKFEDLKGENNALKERILLLESGLSKKLDSLSSELKELKKQVSQNMLNSVGKRNNFILLNIVECCRLNS